MRTKHLEKEKGQKMVNTQCEMWQYMNLRVRETQEQHAHPQWGTV